MGGEKEELETKDNRFEMQNEGLAIQIAWQKAKWFSLQMAHMRIPMDK